METSRNPNKISHETLARIIISARFILDQWGGPSKTAHAAFFGGVPDICTARVALMDPVFTQAPEGVRPTLSITKPTGDLANKTDWVLSITYEMYDGSASRRILVLNDEQPAARLGFCDDTPDRYLTEKEAQAVATDLGCIAECG